MSERTGDTARQGASGELAVVTGCSRGIGLAITHALLSRGCRVIGVFGHNDEDARKAAATLGMASDRVTLVKADLSDVENLDTLVEKVKSANIDGLSYIIANVGATDKTPFANVTPEKWNWVVRSNLTVPFFLVQRLAGFLRDGIGKIIFIGAVMGIRPHPISFSYGASKAGLHFLAQCLVKEFSPRGITVNVVAPGFVETAMQAGKSPEHRKRIEDKISLRRFARSAEVADAVMSLLDLDYVTGQVLAVDGGYDFA